MPMKRDRGRKGFTLIELLIVIAIIGIIAALLIPNFLDSLNKARQKNTMATLRNIGTAMMSRITDDGGAAAAGQDGYGVCAVAEPVSPCNPLSGEALESALVPTYIQSVPKVDAWKKKMLLELLLDPAAEIQAMAVSLGKDGVVTPFHSLGAHFESTFFATDYNQDIIWLDGQFVRYPAGSSPNPTH